MTSAPTGRAIAIAFVKLMTEAQQLSALPYGTAKARASTTDHLKRLWDSYDGAETADDEISGEAVHLVLNERGEGRYCAV